MQYFEFVDLVRRMRKKQKEYFNFSESPQERIKILEEAKQLEREVDRQLKKSPAQSELF